MKTCTACQETKPFTEFHKNRQQKDGYACQCKDCTNAANKARYRDESTGRKDYIAARHEANTSLVKRYKRFCGCRFCGEREPIALDLHHKDPSQKDKEVGRMACGTRQRLKTEIRKCVVLCANCHRKVHAGLLEI